MWEGITVADDLHYPELIPIRNAVLKWSRTQHLDADWCREIALRTIDHWARADGLKANEWNISYGGAYRSNPTVEAKLLPLPGFPPYVPFRHSSAEEYLEEVKRWMRTTIIPLSIWHQLKNAFISPILIQDGMLDKFIEQDIKRMIKVAARYANCVEELWYKKHYKEINRPPEEAKHIRWAVKAQVGNENLSSIAEGENPPLLIGGETPNTGYVSREVKKILKAIDLPPREGLFKRGRKKSSKTRKTTHHNVRSAHQKTTP